MSTITKIRADAIKELLETVNDDTYSFLYASTRKNEDTIKVRGNFSNDDAFNISLALIKKISEEVSVESILRQLKEALL